MMHKAWRSLEEVPYCFTRPSIKFQGHTDWKIDDLNPIWVRLLGRLKLSNPWDLLYLISPAIPITKRQWWVSHDALRDDVIVDGSY